MREREREGEIQRGREGGREGGRERDGGREREREREGGREGEKRTTSAASVGSDGAQLLISPPTAKRNTLAISSASSQAHRNRAHREGGM